MSEGSFLRCEAQLSDNVHRGSLDKVDLTEPETNCMKHHNSRYENRQELSNACVTDKSSICSSQPACKLGTSMHSTSTSRGSSYSKVQGSNWKQSSGHADIEPVVPPVNLKWAQSSDRLRSYFARAQQLRQGNASIHDLKNNMCNTVSSVILNTCGDTVRKVESFSESVTAPMQEKLKVSTAKSSSSVTESEASGWIQSSLRLKSMLQTRQGDGKLGSKTKSERKSLLYNSANQLANKSNQDSDVQGCRFANKRENRKKTGWI